MRERDRKEGSKQQEERVRRRADQEVLLVPLNVGTARREDGPLGMLLPAPPERNIRRPFLSDVVPAK